MTSLDFRRATQGEVSGRLAPALVGVVFFLGYIAFEGWPRNVQDAFLRIGLSCLPAIVLAIIADRVPKLSRLLLFAVNFAAVLVCAVPTLIAMVQPTLRTWQQFALVAGTVGVGVGGIATLTQMLRQRDGTVLTLLVMIGMTFATAALLQFAGSTRLALVTLPLALGIVAVWIVGAFHHPLRTSRGIYTIVLAILCAQLASGHLWAEGEGVPLWAGAAVLGSPLYTWFVRVPWIARRRPWQRVIIGLLLTAVPAATACAVMGYDYRTSWSSSITPTTDSAISPSSYDSFKP